VNAQESNYKHDITAEIGSGYTYAIVCPVALLVEGRSCLETRVGGCIVLRSSAQYAALMATPPSLSSPSTSCLDLGTSVVPMAPK